MNEKLKTDLFYFIKKIYSSFLLLLLSLNAYAQMDTESINKAYQQSYQYEKTQNYTDAIKAISVVAMHYPKAYTPNLRMGYLYYKSGHYANAIKHYEIAHQALKEAITPLLGMMSVNISTQNYDEVERAGFQILKVDLYNYYANLKLGYVFLQQKKLKAAEKTILKMLAKYPEDVAFLTQYAQLLSAQENHAGAAGVYQSILILDPENVAAKYYFSVSKTHDNKDHAKKDEGS